MKIKTKKKKKKIKIINKMIQKFRIKVPQKYSKQDFIELVEPNYEDYDEIMMGGGLEFWKD